MTRGLVALVALIALCTAGIPAGTASAAPKHGTGLKLASRTQVDPRLVQLDFRTPAIAGGHSCEDYWYF